MATLALNLAIGFAASALISLLAPNQKQESARLSDLSAPKSNYGTRIPKVWGSVRLAGNLIWASKIKEKKSKQRGGKGGASAVNYSYFGSFAMLLCEGPIQAISRIWLNSKLVYNVQGDASQKTFERSLKFRDDYLRFYLGTADQSPDPLIQASMGAEHTPAYRHRAYLVFDELPLNDYGNRIPTVTVEVSTNATEFGDRITAHKADLAIIIREICVGCGLKDDEIDTSEIYQPVTGFWINNVQAARESLSQLQQAYFFDCVESDGQLKFIKQQRPGAITTIPKDYLAAHEYGQQRPSNFEEIRTQDLELPSEIDVTYLDPSFNYAESMQYSRSSVTLGANAQSISLPLVLTNSEAKTVADRLLYLAWIRRRRYKFSLSNRYAFLDPGDVIELQLERTLELQISKLNVGANLLLEIEAIAYEDNVFAHQATIEAEYCETINNGEGENTYQLSRRSLSRLSKVSSGSTTFTPDSDYTYDLLFGIVTRVEDGSIPDGETLTICYELDEKSPPPDPVVVAGDTTLRLLDIPLISDRDTDNGLYVAARGGENWRFGAVYISRNGGATYEFVTQVEESIFGTCNNVLAAGSAVDIDSLNSISVTILDGELESVAPEDLETGKNTALVGSEIIRFQSAILTGKNTYTLSNLQRGRRGTEWAIATHSVGESFYLLSDEERLPLTSSDIGRTLQFKALSEGQSLQEVAPISILYRGESLKPYAPINLSATKDQLGNIRIEWVRRDRKAGDRIDYANFPLSEFTEKYQVEILSGATVVRTESCSSSNYIYTAERQVADFGSVQSTISVRLYQISGLVGRGSPVIATLTPVVVYTPPTIIGLSSFGSNLLIQGKYLSGATSVKIDGIEAIFSIDSDTKITAQVPQGAAVGAVEVTTPGGIASF